MRDEAVHVPRERPCEAEEADEDEEESGDESDDEPDSESEEFYFSAEEDSPEGQDPRAKVLSVLELENLFERAAPDLSGESFQIPIAGKKFKLGSVLDFYWTIPDKARGWSCRIPQCGKVQYN